MYSTCIHCNAKLGANEVIEIFPVGRRLAFDAARGRLWVVCPKCLRWNLSPLDERWEAIEQCEREYRGTRLRASTDNIGLAKTREGLELVRIGVPPRPEMAAWRYAREFRRRWVRRGVPVAGTVLGASVLNGLISVAPRVAFPGAAGLLVVAFAFARGGARVRMLGPDSRVSVLRRKDVGHSALIAHHGDGWAVRYGEEGAAEAIHGPEATRLMRGILTSMNFRGGPPQEVRGAERLLDDAGSAEAFLRRLARASRASGATEFAHYPWDVRLALEMALHEDTERRALEGELAQLAEDWALAEEVARIADDMFVPAAVRARLAALKLEARP